MLSSFEGQWLLMGGGILALIISFALSALLTPAIAWVARRRGWIAEPRADRWHKQPVALMGGIAIVLSFFFTVTVLAGGRVPWLLWIGPSLIFLSGLLDDLRGMNPVQKLIIQMFAAVLVLQAGWSYGIGLPFWLSLVLTLFWVIGLTNAMNLLDNMDGLAGGLSAISAIGLGILALRNGDSLGFILSFALAGSVAGFLIFNFSPARVFMGDCGSLFLGYTLAVLSIMTQARMTSSVLASVLVVPVLVMTVPILDTTLVTLRRAISGRRVDRGGTDHTSHRLVALGISEKRAVLLLYGVGILFSGIALTFDLLGTGVFFVTLLISGLGVVLFGVILSNVRIYNAAEEELAHLNTHSSNGRGMVILSAAFQYKKILGALFADSAAMVLAFLAAHDLRYEGTNDSVLMQYSFPLLPWIIFLKILVLYFMGMYTVLWRYAGTSEFIRLVKATALASGVVVVSWWLWNRLEGISRAVLFLDWLFTLLGLGAVRFAYRALRQYLSLKRDVGKKVLLYGAGDGGFVALRELLQNQDRQLIPVGFIDDDPEKTGSRMQGYPVLGSVLELERIASEFPIDEIIVTTAKIPEQRKAQLKERCTSLGIGCRTMHMVLGDLG